jgi:type IV secretory pathway VirB2 component (pilin)
MKRLAFFSIAICAAVASVAFTFHAAPVYSGFAAGFAKWTLAIAAFWAFDVYVLDELDTIRQIKQGNVAYGLLLLAVAVIGAACIATA